VHVLKAQEKEVPHSSERVVVLGIVEVQKLFNEIWAMATLLK
jgi:hypothetical protein